ncbi:MAG TPA: hypothetical protein VKA09_16370 [Nitrososphaeraceae archaeon]|nr:hypothetical protein [Nitrososphaeraceae archaeon]
MAGWSSWGENLGGDLRSGPAVSSWALNRLDCFVKWSDNTMRHKWFAGSRGWSDWEDLGGIILDNPAAVSWGYNRIDTFVRGTNNHMYHKWWDGSRWSDWEDLGGDLRSGPAVSSWAPNRLDCFVKWSDNTMRHKWFAGSRGWSDWEDLGGVSGLIMDNPAAVSWGPNRIDCFVRGGGMLMYHKWFAGAPASFVRLHVKILADPTSFTIEQMIDAMREVYATANIRVDIASRERLDLPLLEDVEIGECRMGSTTSDQNELFNNRNNVGTDDIVAYFVRTTIDVANGCAAHPIGKPGCVVVRLASRWTLAHEIGHVLGLAHVETSGGPCLLDRLMTGCGTVSITNPPPDLIDSEIRRMEDSTLTRR